MRRALAVVLGPILFGALAPAAPVPRHLKGPPLSIPTAVGTKWVYESNGCETTVTITRVKEKDGVLLVTKEWTSAFPGSASEVVESVGPSGVHRVAELGRPFDVPPYELKLPYREGETWDGSCRTGEFISKATRTAGGWEKVRVPAGEFTAARVVWDLGGKGVTTATEWYAHGIGLVQETYTVNNVSRKSVLKSFTPGKE
jgi:hypothetical protein